MTIMNQIRTQGLLLCVTACCLIGCVHSVTPALVQPVQGTVVVREPPAAVQVLVVPPKKPAYTLKAGESTTIALTLPALPKQHNREKYRVALHELTPRDPEQLGGNLKLELLSPDGKPLWEESGYRLPRKEGFPPEVLAFFPEFARDVGPDAGFPLTDVGKGLSLRVTLENAPSGLVLEWESVDVKGLCAQVEQAWPAFLDPARTSADRAGVLRGMDPACFNQSEWSQLYAQVSNVGESDELRELSLFGWERRFWGTPTWVTLSEKVINGRLPAGKLLIQHVLSAMERWLLVYRAFHRKSKARNPVLQALHGRLRDPDESVRSRALQTLVYVNDQKTLVFLKKQFQKKDNALFPACFLEQNLCSYPSWEKSHKKMCKRR